MKYQSLYGFYWFGTCIRYLQDAEEGRRIHGRPCILWNIEQFFSNLSDMKLTVTERVAHAKLDKLIGDLRNANRDGALTSGQARLLGISILSIRDTLEAEIKGVGAYTPTPKRLDLNRLLENVGPLFSPHTYDSLPDIARFDFSEAGKCIAFECPTAAAFHILRATEACLRFYYNRMVRRKRISNLMWGPIVADLRHRNLTKKYDILNNHLDNIRKSFRNPTQHPEAKYDIHEVQDLWSVCVDVVNRMIRILHQETRL